MSATIIELNRHRSDHERLLAASTAIIKLEARVDLLSHTLGNALAAMEGVAVSLETPPMPMPLAAAGIRKTIALLKQHQRQAETFGGTEVSP